MAIVSNLLGMLACDGSDGADQIVLIKHRSFTCWTPPHTAAVAVSLWAVGCFLPAATLTPFQVVYPSVKADVLYQPLSIMITSFCKCVVAAVNIFLGESPVFCLTTNVFIALLLHALNRHGPIDPNL